MRFKIFTVGYSIALLLFVLTQHEPISVPHEGFHRSVDLTQAVEVSLLTSTYARLQLTDRALLPDTRIESPAMLIPGLWTVNQIPAARLHAPLVVLNVEHNVAADPNYQIGMEDIARWEARHGQIPLGSVVVARTGWQPHGNLRTQARMVLPGAQPSFSDDATRFLVEGRVVLGLGSDRPKQIVRSTAHDYASRHSVYELTNVANLGSVPESGSTLLIAPEMVPGSVENRAHLTAMTE